MPHFLRPCLTGDFLSDRTAGKYNFSLIGYTGSAILSQINGTVVVVVVEDDVVVNVDDVVVDVELLEVELVLELLVE